ncbi:cyclic nucleotide-binding domain-containing protein [Ditylenchus destructor]|uniref:Cyclic nucleotide-binding domain-containing protein n=1 Tax=Ditylenchus destructor TaxID=166010 RepID=A0AAD4N2D3_9BILA|nr:cyclic nucleotide-binding domain-containing protein [Ditylenchus destructor]
MDRLSRQELLEEIQQRDELITRLKSQLEQYQNYLHGRKIAVSAPETDSCEYSPDGKFFHKDPKTFATIESTLLANEFLCQLERCEIEEMIRSMYPVDAQKDTSIIRQGEYGSLLYVLEEGRVQVTKDSRFIRIMEAPCVFGELAILYHCERTASVKALTPCRIWAIDRQIFHSIMVNTAKSKHNATVTYLKRCRRFSRLTDGQLHLMASLAREEHWIFRTEIDNSQIAGRIYVISKGRITLRRQSTYSSTPELQSLGPGDIFGEIERVSPFLFLQSGTTGSPSPSSPPSSGGGLNPPQIPSNTHRKSLPIASSFDDRYFVDSVEGCHLLVMLVEQLVRSLDLSTAAGGSQALPSVDSEDSGAGTSLSTLTARTSLHSRFKTGDEDLKV